MLRSCQPVAAGAKWALQKIVDAAKLTKAAFCYHFETKEDVLHEIRDQFMDFQLRRIREVLAEGGVPERVLRRVMTGCSAGC